MLLRRESLTFVKQSSLLPVESLGHLLPLANLQLHWTRDRTHLRIIVFIDPRLERLGAYGILRPQAEVQLDRVSRSKRIEVENALRRRLAELFQASTLLACTLLLVALQVFADQVEPRRNAQVNHHQVRALIQILPAGASRGGNGILRKMCSAAAPITTMR